MKLFFVRTCIISSIICFNVVTVFAQEQGQNQVIDEARMNDRGRGPEREYNNTEDGTETRPRPEDMQEQRTREVDLLADPNEIKARIKTFEGLEKSIADVNSQSKIGIRRWKQIRIDNKATLVNNVQRQIQEEITLIRTISLEEKAKNTTIAADALLTKTKDRTTKIVREIRASGTDDQQTRTTGTGRGRGRSGRGGGRSGMQDNNTERRGRRGSSRSNDSGGDNEEQEQVDPEEQAEIDRWLNADVQDYDSKVTLFTAINEQVMNEFSLIRQASEQEEAKKTTAAIDGLLLTRKIRYDALNQYIQEEKAKLEAQEERDSRNTDGQTDNQTGGRRRRR